MTPKSLIEPARHAGTALLRSQTDARLVDMTRDGNERAFEAIVHRYSRPLLRYCSRLLPPARAEDAVQQAFVSAHRAIHAGDAELNLRPWLYRIAHNTSLNLLRQNGFDHLEVSDQIDGVETPPQAFERGERLRTVVAAVQELPERQRNAIVLQAVEGRSYDEIAVELGVTDGAVRQLLNRARNTLREAAAAVTPTGLLTRLASSGADAPVAERIAAAVASAGGGALLAKTAATLVVAGAVAGGASGALPGGGGSGGSGRDGDGGSASPAALVADAPADSHAGTRAERIANAGPGGSRGARGGRGTGRRGGSSADDRGGTRRGGARDGGGGGGDDSFGDDDRTGSDDDPHRGGDDDDDHSGSGSSGSGDDSSHSGPGSGDDGGSSGSGSSGSGDGGSSGSDSSGSGSSGTSGDSGDSSGSGSSGSGDDGGTSGSGTSGGAGSSGSDSSGSGSGTSGSGEDSFSSGSGTSGSGD